MARDMILLILGGIIGIFGAVIGGIFEGLANYFLEGKRETRRERKRWIDLALNWDGKQSLRRADLREADLRGVELVRADLSYADLSRAKLMNANLRGTHLRGANLKDANLAGAILSEADLHQATLDGADLRGAWMLPYNEWEELKTYQSSSEPQDPTIAQWEYLLGGSARLPEASFAGTKVNNRTQWPHSFKVPRTVVED